MPDWIFHHLHYKFDKIAIYINNSNDSSEQIAEALKENKKLDFVDGNPFFAQTSRPPQIAVYLHELSKARWQGFSHIMFLDIDEFLLSKTLDFNINEFASQLTQDVCCFEWLHKMDEKIPFGPSISENIVGRKAPQVKSLISTRIKCISINPHNIYNPNASYVSAEGEYVSFDRNNYSRIDKGVFDTPVKSTFVLHRMIRHEIEYVAALSRGRPISREKQGSMFKNNRNGIFTDDKNVIVSFPKETVERYENLRQQFYQQYNLTELVEEGRKQVLVRYSEVLGMIRNAPLDEKATLEKVLKNISHPEVVEAYEQYLSSLN